MKHCQCTASGTRLANLNLNSPAAGPRAAATDSESFKLLLRRLGLAGACYWQLKCHWHWHWQFHWQPECQPESELSGAAAAPGRRPGPLSCRWQPASDPEPQAATGSVGRRMPSHTHESTGNLNLNGSSSTIAAAKLRLEQWFLAGEWQRRLQATEQKVCMPPALLLP